MRPHFHPRALLFDLGDLERLAPRKILRLTHAFVSHTHMDHFSGLDRVLRTCLHRDATLHLFGPPAFCDQVEHKLAAYSFIETPFLQADVESAARKYHLTARQAELVAREAAVKRLVPFHFSPRYAGEEDDLRREAADAFAS